MLVDLIVTLRDGRFAEGLALVTQTTEQAISDCSDVVDGENPNYFLGGAGIVLVHASPDQRDTLERVAWSENSPILAVETSRTFATSATLEARRMFPAPDLPPAETVSGAWTGRGVKLAILDTGLDPTHPDFLGRPHATHCFVKGKTTTADDHGHGTHCTGIAAGGRLASGGVYGLATDAELYVGKVLNDIAWGNEWAILRGLCWAVRDCHCDVVLLAVNSGLQVTSVAYQRMASWALNKMNCVVVGAAGNTRALPVGHPANATGIMAVGALQDATTLWPDSSPSGTSAGSEVDLAALGYLIRSAWPMPIQYADMSGTSMAAAFVAGAAALWAEKSGLRGQKLWDCLTGSTAASALPVKDVGAGQAVTP